MPPFALPVRDETLARELRSLRAGAGLTGEWAAAQLGWSPSKISRIETGQNAIDFPDIVRLLDLYGAPDARREQLLTAAEARISTPRGNPDPVFAGAQQIRQWSPLIVPPLLQTSDYAQAISQSLQAVARTPPAVIRRQLGKLQQQQLRLTNGSPLTVQAILGEAVLQRYRCIPDDVMRGQLEQLARYAELPNVEIRVLPGGTSAPAGIGAFTHTTFAAANGLQPADTVLLHHLSGDTRITGEEETYLYQIAFEELRTAAMNEKKTFSRIQRAQQSVR